MTKKARKAVPVPRRHLGTPRELLELELAPAELELLRGEVLAAGEELLEALDRFVAVTIRAGEPPSMSVAILQRAGLVGDVSGMLRDVIVVRTMQLSALFRRA